jgi:hypothetical protein
MRSKLVSARLLQRHDQDEENELTEMTGALFLGFAVVWYAACEWLRHRRANLERGTGHLSLIASLGAAVFVVVGLLLL